MTLLLLLACTDTDIVPLHFDGPVAAAILPAGEGPFEDPVGLVANQRSGVLTPLDVKHGRLLTTDLTASFVRGAPLALGYTRLLTDVAVSGDGTHVTAWAIDARRGVLVEAPWLLGATADGDPIEAEPVALEPVFADADASGDAVTVDDLATPAGRATTEVWTLTFDGRLWRARGTVSGPQSQPVAWDVPWTSGEGELSLRLRGTATAGDTLTVAVDSGIVEHAVPGRAMGLVRVGGRVVVSDSLGGLSVFAVGGDETSRGTLLGRVQLPPTGDSGDGDPAQPYRLAASPDGRVFATDGGRAVAWVLRFDLDMDPATVPVETIDVAAPLVDLAYVAGEDMAGAPFERLFVAPLGAQRVDTWDLAMGAWHDPNPATSGAEGVDLAAPVMGLGASAGPVRLQMPDSWGALARVPTVNVTTGDGRLYQLEGPTGCAVVTERGPHTPNPERDSGASYATLVDLGAASDATLAVDAATGEQALASSCGGVSRGETWTITFRSATQDWEVEGTRSGVQVQRARSEQRYLSDEGAISFVIATGARPPTDGDRFSLVMDSGLLQLRCVDVGEDGTCSSTDTPWDLPGRPVGFETLNGPTDGAWDVVDRRQYVLVPVTSSDIVARGFLDAGTASVSWQ